MSDRSGSASETAAPSSKNARNCKGPSPFRERFRKLYEQINGKAIEKRELARLIRSEGAQLLGRGRHRRYSELRRELQSLLRRKVVSDAALCVTESGSRLPIRSYLCAAIPT